MFKIFNVRTSAMSGRTRSQFFNRKEFSDALRRGSDEIVIPAKAEIWNEIIDYKNLNVWKRLH